MMEPGEIASESTDVGVVSLADRRRILDLEAQVADLGRQLAEAMQRAKPGIDKKLPTKCYHHGRFTVADHDQLVECIDCGSAMDPYVVLRKIAHREINFCYTLNALRDERKKIYEEVQKLKAQRSRLRRILRGMAPDEGIET